MDYEATFSEVKDGRILTDIELLSLRHVFLTRGAAPYALSQIALVYTTVMPHDGEFAASVVALTLQYAILGGEDLTESMQWLILSVNIYWRMPDALYGVAAEVARHWRDVDYECLFHQICPILGRKSYEDCDEATFALLKDMGRAAHSAGRNDIARWAALGCRFATEGPSGQNCVIPEDVPAYLASVVFPGKV